MRLKKYCGKLKKAQAAKHFFLRNENILDISSMDNSFQREAEWD